MPSRYPVEVRRQVVELARSGTRVVQLAETFGVTQATIYNWLKQDRIDRGEEPGLSTRGQMELAAAKRRIQQLETELAVSRKVNEVFLEQNLPPKPLPGDRLPDRAGIRRLARLRDARCLLVRLLRLTGPSSVRDGRCGTPGSPGRSRRCTRTRVVLGPHAGRAAQPQTLEDPHRTRYCDPRLHRDLAQHQTTPQQPEHDHTDRIRKPTPTTTARRLIPNHRLHKSRGRSRTLRNRSSSRCRETAAGSETTSANSPRARSFRTTPPTVYPPPR